MFNKYVICALLFFATGSHSLADSKITTMQDSLTGIIGDFSAVNSQEDDSKPLASLNSQSNESKENRMSENRRRDRRRLRENSCYLTFAFERDNNGNYCESGYGVVYDGVILNNSCYYSIETAHNVINNSNVCSLPTPLRAGRCTLLRPNERDDNSRYCDKAYGFIYEGHIVNNMCFYSADRAAIEMQNTSACYYRQHIGSCSLAMPGVRDVNGNYCDNSYGVMYRGHILDNSCYYNLQVAQEKMYNYSFCN
ncbi:MAG: hypothetical protein H6625_09595 [Bdellovibrionaceae bacterium]|nr:hypothetical protein [Pseudobdellovibrionaceae bacterium]